MKALMAFLSAGILAGVFLEYRPRGGTEAVVAVGELEAPLPPPRVRVRNLQPAAVHVWYVGADAAEAQRVGTVPALATMTFPLPEDRGPVGIVIRAELGGEPFMSGVIAPDLDTDVTVNVASPLARSVVEVARMPVIRELSSR